jgi:hypothetical protein
MLKDIESALKSAHSGHTGELKSLISELRELNVPKKRGRKPGGAVGFAAAFKTFKGSEEYKSLYGAIQNREQVIEHLIWRAFNAGYKAK